MSRPSPPSLESLAACFQGVLASTLATCSADGIPNVAYLSHVTLVDERHIALSHQFFNKSKRNTQENPLAAVRVTDPRTLLGYVLRVRFSHARTDGPLFAAMSHRIEAIASQTGMSRVFRLLSADVYEVLAIEPLDGELLVVGTPPPGLSSSLPPPRSATSDDLAHLLSVSHRLNRAESLEALLDSILEAVDEDFGFRHAMILLPDRTDRSEPPQVRLQAVATRGYPESGVGAEVVVGEGLLGIVAQSRRSLHIAGMGWELTYARAAGTGESEAARRSIPLPGLANAQSHLGVALVARDELVGVLAVESEEALAFDAMDEAVLGLLGNNLALAIQVMLLRGAAEELCDAGRSDDATSPGQPPGEPGGPPADGAPARDFCLYRHDDCVLLDGDYLIRNVPARILWRLLREHHATGRTRFTNRELRLDTSLGLPDLRDNLEARLVLLRKRLEQKCPDVRIVPDGRGRFRLEVGARYALREKDG